MAVIVSIMQAKVHRSTKLTHQAFLMVHKGEGGRQSRIIRVLSYDSFIWLRLSLIEQMIFHKQWNTNSTCRFM